MSVRQNSSFEWFAFIERNRITYTYAIPVRDKLYRLRARLQTSAKSSNRAVHGVAHTLLNVRARQLRRLFVCVKPSIIALNCKSCSSHAGSIVILHADSREVRKTGWSMMVSPSPRRKGNDHRPVVLDNRFVLSRKRWDMMDASFVCRNHVRRVIDTCRVGRSELNQAWDISPRLLLRYPLR